MLLPTDTCFCYLPIYLFDIHMSVHRDIIPNYSQQDATFLDLFISTVAVHVSGEFNICGSEHHAL